MMLRVLLLGSCLVALGSTTPLRVGSTLRGEVEDTASSWSPFGPHFSPLFKQTKNIGFPHAEVIFETLKIAHDFSHFSRTDFTE